MQKKQLSNYPVWFDGTNINEAAGSLYAGDGIRRKTGRRGSISWINFKY